MNVTVEIERRGEEPRPEWVCPSCHQPASMREVRANLSVCPHCGHHLRIGARERIRQLVDEGSFRELWTNLKTLDPLAFVDLETYPERVREAQAKTGLAEAIVTGTARVDGTPCVLAVMDFSFMGGSMGSVVGEKLWRAAELASGEDLPLVAVCTLRRRPHAGGHPEPDADGQDELRRRPDQRGDVAVRRRPRRPLHGRRGGQLRDPRRRVHRRARRPALLQRASRDPADDARGSARGLQHRRAQPGAGPPRRRRGAQGPAREGRQLPATAGGR